MTGAPRGRQLLEVIVRAVVGLLVPLVVFYLLRGAGAGLYLALLVSAVVSALPTAVGLIRTRRINALSAFFAAMVLGSVAVSLLAGDSRFLLAREAILTAVAGTWFLVSAGTRRPLSAVFSKPLLEGRFRWPAHWDELWVRSPRWRRMWRVSSTAWGIGLLADAGARVWLAYTLPPDAVPALATGLYLGTSAVLIVTTSAYYAICGVYRPGSALYPAAEQSVGSSGLP